MPFTFKLSRRLACAWLSPVVAAFAAATACELPSRNTDPDATNSAIVQLVATPGAVTLSTASTRRFAAYGRRENGDSAPVSVEWSATGGGITPDGLYTAGAAAGDYVVVAAQQGGALADTASVAIVAPPAPGPETVTDLRVRTVARDAVTLEFTEVDDGAGQPADYQVRWAAGAISWGAAANVAQGDCTTPMTGTAVGATRSCTVPALASGTMYQFQLVALRGELDRDAVFGGLSNVATGVTTSVPAEVASVTVTPAAATSVVGGIVVFSAVVKDQAGNTLVGRSIAWTSGDPRVATVAPTGHAAGLSAGTTSITATSEGQSGTTTLTVTAAPPPGGGAWPNEPAGFTLVEETGWEAGALGSWFRVHQTADKPITVVDVGDSPVGETKALEIAYPAGHTGGGGTELRYNIPQASRRAEIFVGFYVQVSADWQGHTSAINKMLYLHDGAAVFSAMWYEIFGSGSSPLSLYVVNQSGAGPVGLHENVNPVSFHRGRWHRVEIYQKQGAPGVVRVWIDGVLAIDRADVHTRNAPFDNITISGIWGGIGDTKRQNDYMRFDRIRISTR